MLGAHCRTSGARAAPPARATGAERPRPALGQRVLRCVSGHRARTPAVGGRLRAGVAVVVEPDRMQDVELDQAADGLALDTIAFDQRGCLSPRVVLVQGSDEFAADFTSRLARALSAWERAVPRGRLDEAEAADARRYEDTMIYVGGALRAGRGMVAIDPVAERALVPPVGRYLHVTRTADPLARLVDWADRITCVGMWGAPLLAGLCETKLGPRRDR